MKRSNFIKALVGLVVAPSIIVNATESKQCDKIDLSKINVSNCPPEICGIQHIEYQRTNHNTVDLWDECWNKLLSKEYKIDNYINRRKTKWQK